MKSLSHFPEVYLYPEVVDFRKGRRSLAAFVQGHLQENPFAPVLFLFMNRKRDTIKALYWDKTGFAMWEKGLEKERFPWPKPPFPRYFLLTIQQVEWLLEGVDIWNLKSHVELNYSRVV